MGERTNNQAEYEALIAALEAAAGLHAEEVTCHLDSEIVTKHLTGEYRVRSAELLKLWMKVRELRKRFSRVSFVHVPRENEFIREADRLVNVALDAVCGSAGNRPR